MMELTQTYVPDPGFFKRLGAVDWLYGAALLTASLLGLYRYGSYMDYYEKAVLFLAAPTFTWLGWHWKSVRWLMAVLAILSLTAIGMYGGSLQMADQKFFLKYLLSSQSAVLWMSVFFVLSTLFYWGGMIARSTTGFSIG